MGSMQKTNVIRILENHGSTYEVYKKAAEASGDKSIEMVKSKELLTLTGYIHGGCSPVGMKKEYPTFIEEIASGYDHKIS